MIKPFVPNAPFLCPLKVNWSWRHLEDVLNKTSLPWMIRLADVLKKPSQDVLMLFFQEVLKTSWRSATEVNIFVLHKTSWWRLEGLLWRRRRKTSSTRIHQDEYFPGSSCLESQNISRTTYVFDVNETNVIILEVLEKPN